MNDKELHILHLPSWYLPEGGQFCRNQVQALNAKGVKTNILANVTVSIRKYGFKKVCRFIGKPYLSKEDDINVYRHFYISIPFLRKWNGILWSRQTVRLFQKYCKKYGIPDLIHVHSVLWGGYAAYLIQKKTNIPYIITEHKGIFGLSCQYATEQFQEWQTPFMQKAFSNAKMIVPVSESQIVKIKSYLTENVPVRVISNMVDTDFFYYKERKKKEDSIQAVMVNGFNPYKAYDILFPAADIALEAVQDLKITIVGEDFEGEKFNELINKVKNKDRISFTGELDMYGVREHLWKADFYIISSRVEAHPISTLEALATGLPVVCTEVVPETIADGTNAIRVPIENIEKLAGAIIKMSGDFTKYDSKEISNQIKSTASKEIIAAKLIESYNDVISR